MKLEDQLLRAVASFGGGMLAGIGITDHRLYAVATGGALIGGAVGVPIQSLLKPKKDPLWKLEKRSLELERETGLVFDNFGTSCKLWPGYWEFLERADLRAKWVVRPEGCVDKYWIKPEEYVGLEAVDYFENEVPKLLEQDKLAKTQQAELKTERLRQRQIEEQARMRDAYSAQAGRQLEPASHCQHELMNNPAGAPGSTFCYKCGSTFPGAATPLPAAAAERAASGSLQEMIKCGTCGFWSTADIMFMEGDTPRCSRCKAPRTKPALSSEERREINRELESYLRVLSSRRDLSELAKKELVEKCDRLFNQLDVGRTPSGGRVPHPETQACQKSFNGKHRWVHGACKLCGASKPHW